MPTHRVNDGCQSWSVDSGEDRDLEPFIRGSAIGPRLWCARAMALDARPWQALRGGHAPEGNLRLPVTAVRPLPA